MSKEPILCKQRFKAVENFFRRIAFNLGNTPSQTDVKIISCIPIDVTDLQHKIIRLQNELENTKKTHAPCLTTAPRCVTPVLLKGHGDDDIIRVDKPCEEDSFNCKSSMSHDYDGRYDYKRQQKSSSLVYRSETSQDYRFYSDHRIPIDDKTRAARNQTLRNFFCKKRNRTKRKNCKCNAQIVYYAQTHEKNPFNAYPDDLTSKQATNDFSVHLTDLADNLSRSFISDMIQKQYRPDPIYKVFSNSSNFSAPICKDIATDITTTSTDPNCHCDTEICSCCHGPNIDRHVKRDTAHVPINKARYYDSTHYDLVPVREKASSPKKRGESPRRKKSKRKMVKCCPEEIRPKLVSPILVDYNYYNQSHRPLRNYADTYPKHIPVIMRNRRQMVLKEMAPRRAFYRQTRPLKVARPSRVCYVDYGPTYTKQIGNELTYNISPNTSTLKNQVTGLATTIEIKDSPTTESPAVETITPIDKTEMTLNQIKEILQSVLLEVKTNSKEDKISAPTKKDAFVQNEVSRNNLRGGSQILRSFTYSPYNMNTYSPSCSRQMHSNNFTHAYTGLPGSPVKCTQHYPILIQPQRHMCMGYFGNPNTMKCSHTSEGHHAASAATNTDHIQSRTSETEKLIHEIYKSLAMNLEIPQDTPVDRSNTATSAARLREPDSNLEQNTTHAVSELYRNATQLASSVTPNTDTTNGSKPTFNEASVGSHTAVRKRIVPTRETSSVDSASDKNENRSVRARTPDIESDEQSDTTVTAHTQYQQASSTSDSDEAEPPHVTPVLGKKKKGLFNKMFQMLKPKKINKYKETSINVSSESDSDSDDYQTVYSHGEHPPRPAKQGLSIKSKPKVVYRKYQQRKSNSPHRAVRREPYMEQEHRRRWTEELCFHEDGPAWPRGASPHDSLTRRTPIYETNYETRSAFVRQPMMQPHMAAAMGQNYVNGYGANRQTMHNAVQNATASNYARMPTSPTINYCPRVYPNQGIHISYPGKTPAPGLGIGPPRYVSPRVYRGSHRVTSSKGLSWLRKHGKKFAPACGGQWKNLIIEG